MVTALYRRYRPENFAEMIGQSQVTDPLMTALRTNRVNHAYLFSGPRGCGKTTSARILARCLNCAEGPTDKPCGVCPSCVELSRDGMGSLDVVEIDAASHGGVDDARDLRERAIFAPARDRYKIFIIDEAHMVTSGGFNALLKIVEEPPEHIKFIFATTEPDKVIGTIRSRTHHYPFRLIPPAQLLEYVQQLCETEGVEVAPGVLPLVVRAGGGSARDTLSLLDQLIAGSEHNRVEYERAVALLGYTHGALLSEVIDAIGAHDGAAAFDAVDRVIQTGQDPRRFVEDLLERLRDIIIVAATKESASSVLRGVPAEEIEGMRRQAALFGHAELSRVADIVNDALTEMTGATSPRLHLELMIARTLVPASDDTERGALVRVERLERRIGVDGPDAVGAPGAGGGGGGAGGAGAGAWSGSAGASLGAVPSRMTATPAAALSGSASTDDAEPARGAGSAPASQGGSAPDVSRSGGSMGATSSSVPPADAVDGTGFASASPTEADAGSAARGAESARPVTPAGAAPSSNSASTPPPAESTTPIATAAGEVSLQQLKDAWPEILEAVQKAKMTAWLVVFTAQVRALDGDVLTLAFPSENDVASFKERSAPGQGVSEYLRQAIVDVLGLRVKYRARVDSSLRPETAGPDAATPRSGGAPDAAAPVSPGTAAPGSVAEGQGSGFAAAAPPASGSVAAPGSASTPAGAGTDGWAAAPPADASSAPAWSTPGVSDPGTSVASSPASSPPAPADTAAVEPSAGGAAPAAGGIASGGGTASAGGASAGGAAPAAGTPRGSATATATGAVRSPSNPSRPDPAAAGAKSRAPSRPDPAAAGAKSRASGAPVPTTSWDVVAIPTSSDEEPPPFDEPLPSDEPDLPPDYPEHDAATSATSASSARGVAESTAADRPAGESAASGAGPIADAETASTGTGTGIGSATRPSAPERAARPSGAPDPAARPGALRFEAAPEDDDSASAGTASARPSQAPGSASASRAPASAPTAPAAPPAATAGGRARYGEAVVREILGANFIEEQPLPGREG